jgi:hypothetical protein
MTPKAHSLRIQHDVGAARHEPFADEGMVVMRRVTTLVLAATVLVSTAAIASSTESYFDRSYNFSNIRSFVVQPQQQISTNKLANNSIWGNLIRETLEGNLRTHGITQQREGPADVKITFSIELTERYDTRFVDYGFPGSWGPYGMGPYYGGGWGGWYGGGFNVYTIPYLESRLIVDMVDTKTNQLIWRGFNTDELQLDDVNKDLPDAAADVLKRFYKDTRRGVEN